MRIYFNCFPVFKMMNERRYTKEGRRVRHRIRDGNSDYLPEPAGYGNRDNRYLLPTASSHLVMVFVFLLLLSLWVMSLDKSLPTPLTVRDALANPDQFIAERAMNHLIQLTSLGPRPAGSHENEVLAVDLFKRKINAISEKAKAVHKISFDIQKPSGAFPLHFLDGMTNVYKNVHNIVVKMGPHENTGHSVLINCHFDSVMDSPGASDDGASCAIMLEVFQIISQKNEPLKNNIIFLFNGAEENFLQASHGFITQHPWASEVRTFINMEACGAGGKEILFQAGPNHPWVMEVYSKVVPHPYASSLAQEIFQSGVIPGDTDFRIFRDFGHVSGLDFAWATNGYVYHTKFDNVDQIPLGTLQRTGDNILALAQGLANSHELSHVEAYSSGNIIFFDFLGMFMMRWSENVNLMLNTATAILSIFSMLRNMQSAAAFDVKHRTYLKQFGISCLVVVCSLLATILTCSIIALMLTALGRTMSWFSRPAWIFFLYICPVMFVPMAVVLLASKLQRSALRTPWLLFQLYHDAYLFLATVILMLCTVLYIRSGFIAFIWVLFVSVGNIIQSTIYKHWRGDKWLLYYCAILVLPLSQSLNLIFGAMNLFIPIMARIGAGNNSELILAVITSTMFVLLFSFIIPLIVLVKHPRNILSFLATLFLVAVGLLVFTPLGFPYSGDPQAPSPQRFMLVHTQRIFHDEYGKVRSRETGFWMPNMDHNSPHSIMSLVPGVKDAQLVNEDCKRELYCGLPYLIPVSSLISITHWIPGPAPNISIPANLQLASVKDQGNGIRRLTFSVTGPPHMGLMMSPYPGVEFYNWSIMKANPVAGPRWNDRPTYFVFYGCASDPAPWVFWVDLKGSSGKNISLDVALSSHFLQGPNKVTPELQRLLNEFPPWTHVTSWTATFTSWKF